MEVIQKKSGNTHTFEFNDNDLSFSYKDKSGSGNVEIDYGEFTTKTSIQIDRNEWLRNVGALWCLVGAWQLGSALYYGNSLAGKGFWLLVGAGCLVWYLFTIVKYTVLDGAQSRVYVIQDGQHDKIVGEIMNRRKDQLLKLYGNSDLENEPAKEITKFQWLKENEVMTPEEADIRIAQLERMEMSNNADSYRQLN